MQSNAQILTIYTALSHIRATLEQYFLRDIPYETIRDGLEIANTLSLLLSTCQMHRCKRGHGVKETLLPLAEQALFSATQVVTLYEKTRKTAKRGEVSWIDLPLEHVNHVIRFRRYILEMHECLRIGYFLDD